MILKDFKSFVLMEIWFCLILNGLILSGGFGFVAR